MKIKNILMSGLVAFAMTHTAQAQTHRGRVLEDRNTFSVQFTFGSVFGLEGEVQETTRPIEEIGGPTSGAPPENYSWEDLGFDTSFPTFGLGVEKMWRFITLQGHVSHGKPTVSSVADRNFYIGVGSVTHQGQDYEYLLIPEGTRFTGDIELWSASLRMLITPVTFGNPSTATFTPWLHLGLFGFVADYEIDVGPSQGVTQYENPPRDYVIGGKGTGVSGLAIPEIGLGAEIRLVFTERVRLALQAHAAFLKVGGRTSDFAVSSRNEKTVDVDYYSFGARATLEWAMNDRVDLIAGLDFLYWTGDAEVRATAKTEEEILALREKFDKDVHFAASSLSAFVGLRF